MTCLCVLQVCDIGVGIGLTAAFALSFKGDFGAGFSECGNNEDSRESPR